MEYVLFFTGLILSLVFLSVTGYYPGGLIVPGYLVLCADQPLRIAGTLAVAVAAFLLYRLASRRMILFGRRRFVFLVTVGGLLTMGLSLLLPMLTPGGPELRMVGWVIPGLIANHLDRQGVGVTVASIMIVVPVLWLLSLALPFLAG